MSDKPVKIGDVSGMVCSANGQDLGKVTLQQVRYSTTNSFNLFSLTKMIKQGWKLTGTTKEIKLINGKKELNFDVVMPTLEGILFCMCVKRYGDE